MNIFNNYFENNSNSNIFRHVPDMEIKNLRDNKQNIFFDIDRTLNNKPLSSNVINIEHNNVFNLNHPNSSNMNNLVKSKLCNSKLKNKNKNYEIDIKNLFPVRKESINKSISSDYTDKRAVFKTLKEDEESFSDMKKLMRQMKNRISARRCREKKKNYMDEISKKLEECQGELKKYKDLQKNQKDFELLSLLVN